MMDRRKILLVLVLGGTALLNATAQAASNNSSSEQDQTATLNRQSLASSQAASGPETPPAVAPDPTAQLAPAYGVGSARGAEGRHADALGDPGGGGKMGKLGKGRSRAAKSGTPVAKNKETRAPGHKRPRG